MAGSDDPSSRCKLTANGIEDLPGLHGNQCSDIRRKRKLIDRQIGIMFDVLCGQRLAHCDAPGLIGNLRYALTY